jgi:hypothetical protein
VAASTGPNGAAVAVHRDGAIAEARLKVAGRWHRLRVELDEALMNQCSFYLERGRVGS